jgi:hypothetical protein
MLLLVRALLTVNYESRSLTRQCRFGDGFFSPHWQILRVSSDLDGLWEHFEKTKDEKKRGKLLINRNKSSHNSVQVQEN